MKLINRQPSIKELRTALNVLSSLDIDVPNEIFVCLSDRIQKKEKERLSRRINRMSEEELIRYGSRQKNTLRVICNDGRLLQGRTNDVTFVQALKEVGPDRLKTLSLKVRRSMVFKVDETGERKRIKNYQLLAPGLFVYEKTTASEKKQILQSIDKAYQLDWEVSVI